MRRTTAGLTIGLVPIVVAGLLAGTAVAGAAGYERQQAQQHPVVQGKDAVALPFAPDADDEAAKRPVPAPEWPQAAKTAGFATALAGAAAVPVEVLGRKETRPMVLKVGESREKTAKVSVDYSKFRTAFGADYGNRLRLVVLPECALSTPGKAECAGKPVPSTNDGTRITGDAPAGSLVAVEPAPEGSTGDFKATDLKASNTWEHSGSSGGFFWNYPLRFPPSIGGPAPDLALDYSSQSVDGQTAATNNQPSWVGEGFSLSPGYIERGYRGCSDDMGNGAVNTTKTGDLCWFSDNAVMSLGGQTVELIRDASGTFRARTESGMRIEKRTGAANGDNDGEHWVVTDQKGTQYWFGLQRLPGWAAGKGETQSVFTAPVLGNHANEPCKAATYAASSCTQAWRWGLDYVVDAHGNSMSLWYAKETNKYAFNLDAQKLVEYVRGGRLTRIDYGTRTDAEYAGVPAQVVFGEADRCEANCGTKNATTWKDVPWDLECTGTPCLVGSPTFWNTKRLAKITTSTGGRAVDSWTLRHSYPDPGDNTRAGLWLDGIIHTGHVGGTASLPEVTFAGVSKPNRVHGFGPDTPPMSWRRVERIRNETGGEIAISYSGPECVAGKVMPGAPEANTLRCHPAYWTRTGATDPTLDYFHKYVVTAVSEVDHTGGAPVKTSSYEYVDGAAWHFADDDGLALDKVKTWNSWRGYQKVRVTEGTGEGTRYGETTYFRGMDGDRLPGGGKRSVQVPDSEGGKVADSPGLEGREREKRTFAGPGGAEISGEIIEPWLSEPTSTRDAAGSVVQARFVDDRTTKHRIALDAGRGHMRTQITTDFDQKTGKPLVKNDLGDIKTAEDDQCTRTSYVQDTGKWLIGLESREHVYALSCDKTPTRQEEIVSDRLTSYDGKANGVAPVKGDVTRVEEISGFDGKASYAVTERKNYDVHGREIEKWDSRDARTATAYTPATGGPVTGKTSTNALNHRTATTLEPAWADAVLSATDPNGKVTGRGYDALGRLTGVWKPGRTKGASEPHIKHSYQFRTTAPTTVTTEELHPDDVRYVVSTMLYDGFLRVRQTQKPAPNGARVISDTIYDPVGRKAKENPGYPVSGAPNTNLFVALNDNGILNQKLTTFDAADRPVTETVKAYNTVKEVTTTRYGGDRVDVTPPPGGTASTTIKDGRDRKIELREYRSGQPIGDHQSTKYTYTKKNQEETVVDPAGNTWTYDYDVRGRRVSESDPDAGVTRTEYNNAGDKTSVTDPKNRKLVYTYDVLGRKTGLYEGSESGVKRAAWTYDFVEKGYPAASTRFQEGKAFVSEVTGYDGQYQQTATKITVPDTTATPAGKLAGTYEFKNTYKANGDLATSSYPKAGALATEVIEYRYDDQARPSVLKHKVGLTPEGTYVAGTQYTNLNKPGVVSLAVSNTGKLLETGYSYLDDGKLFATKTTKETGTRTVADVRNHFDTAGNVVKVADGTDTQCFGYDYLQRLTEAWTPSSGDCAGSPDAGALGGPAAYWQSFGYDAIGNRKSRVQHATPKGDVTTTYAYPEARAPKPHALSGTTVTDNSGTRTTSYTYDEIGNTTSRPGSAGEQKLTWDVEGNLASSSDGGGVSSFVDDAEGNRLVRSDASGTTLFLSNMQVRLDKASGAVDTTRFYSYQNKVVAQRTSQGVTWLVADEQGTANLAITESDQVVAQRRQTPFGEVRSQSAAWPNKHGFLFGAEEPGGLTNVGVRQYDADSGRFTSVDPLMDKETPQQMNAYAYANNSPITLADPTGLFFEDGLGGGWSDDEWDWGLSDDSGTDWSNPFGDGGTDWSNPFGSGGSRNNGKSSAERVREEERPEAIPTPVVPPQPLTADEEYKEFKKRMKGINDWFGDTLGSYLVVREFAGATVLQGPGSAQIIAGAAMADMWDVGDKSVLEHLQHFPKMGMRWTLNEVGTPAIWYGVRGTKTLLDGIGRGVNNFAGRIPVPLGLGGRCTGRDVC